MKADDVFAEMLKSCERRIRREIGQESATLKKEVARLKKQLRIAQEKIDTRSLEKMKRDLDVRAETLKCRERDVRLAEQRLAKSYKRLAAVKKKPIGALTEDDFSTYSWRYGDGEQNAAVRRVKARGSKKPRSKAAIDAAKEDDR